MIFRDWLGHGHGRVAVIGAGIGGLVAAFELASRGLEVTVLERARRPAARCARSRSGHPPRRRADRLHHAMGVRGDLRRRGRRPSPSTCTSRPRTSSRATPGAGESGSTCSPTTNGRPTRSARSPAPRRRAGSACSGARAARIYQTLDHPFIRRRGQSLPGLIRGRGDRETSGASARSRRCGARWASISATRGCGSCSAAMPPIAAPRRSSRPRP